MFRLGNVGVEMPGSWTRKTKGAYVGVQEREDGAFLCNIPPACEKSMDFGVCFFCPRLEVVVCLSMSPLILISRRKRTVSIWV